jgi:hypothetical protein
LPNGLTNDTRNRPNGSRIAREERKYFLSAQEFAHLNQRFSKQQILGIRKNYKAL